MNPEQWFNLTPDQQMLVLREKIMSLERLIKQWIAAAGVIGAFLGSVVTHVVEHLIGR